MGSLSTIGYWEAERPFLVGWAPLTTSSPG